MAISWGSWDAPDGAGFRVGVETTVTAVTTSSTTVTWTTKWYVEAEYNVNDSMTLTFGGNISGTDTQTLTTGSSGGYALFDTKTYTYTYSTYGTSPGTRTFSAALSGVYNGANPSKSVTVTIPARPYAAPSAPTGVSEVRNSDTQATVSWTNVTTAQKPYTSLLVRMRTLTGGTWSGYVDVATTTSGATSYVKTGLVANRVYQFAVRSNNSVGSSVFAYDSTPYVQMTPGAPTGVISVLNAGGTTITTTWADTSYVDSGVTFTVQRSVNSGAFANVATGIAQGTLSWTDPTPGAGTNRYQVAAVQATGSLTSAFTQGNLISTIVAPLAPTLLSPNGTSVDWTTNVTITWQHNHGGDSAAQSHYTLEFSSNGGSTWTALVVTNATSTVSSHTITAGTLTNGTAYLWRVKTEGIVSGGFGPFSANATVIGSTTPTVTITSPGAAVNTMPLVVTWAYNQNEASPQASWEAILYAANGTTILQSLSADDTSALATFTYVLVDGVSYVVKVRARSGAGVWSAQASQSFAFSLLPPAAGVIDAEFQPCTGTVVLHMDSEAVVPGVTVPVESVSVERSINGGEWVALVSNMEVPNDFVDLLPVTHGINSYRVTSVSSTPSYFVSDPVDVLGTDGSGAYGQDGLWVFLNYGDSFQNVLRVHGNIDISETSGRVKEAHRFLGRKKPVQFIGASRSRALSASGTLNYDATCLVEDDCRYDSPPSDWNEAGQEAETVCFRDFSGRRVFGMLSDVDTGLGLWRGHSTVSFSVTETDFAETYGPLVIPDLPNLLDEESSSFEGGTVGGWVGVWFWSAHAATLLPVTDKAAVGTYSLRVTVPTATDQPAASVTITNFDVAKTYTATARIWNPSSNPAEVRFGEPFATSEMNTSVRDQWQRVTCSWTGRTGVNLGARLLGNTTAGQQFWIDDIRVYEET